MNNEEIFASDELNDQLVFLLYAGSKELIRLYKPMLDASNLTFTQYIVMLVLMQEGSINVTRLGARLFLDSGTLTPVLKKLELKSFLRRERSHQDERNLIVSLTDTGRDHMQALASMSQKADQALTLSSEDKQAMKALLHKLLEALK